MKDTDGEVHQSDRLLQEAKAVIRLILPNPHDGKYLLARYPALSEECEPGTSVRDWPTYWSFTGIGPLRRLGNESPLEMVLRTAYEQLGISIIDLELVSTFYDRRTTPAKVGRLYYLVRHWNGQTPYQYDTEMPGLRFDAGHKSSKEDQLPLSHERFWVQREYLGSYLSHPELLAATRTWQDWEHKQAKGAGA